MKQICYKILNKLTTEPSHIRKLANLLNTNPMSIKRALEELQKNNVVDFKEEGKNKVYHIKSSLETQTQLKILEHHKRLELIKKHPRFRIIMENLKEVDLVILFGSYAKGLEKQSSDIDIYTNDKKIKSILKYVDSKVSVKVADFDKEAILMKEIIKHHVILKGVDLYYELIY